MQLNWKKYIAHIDGCTQVLDVPTEYSTHIVLYALVCCNSGLGSQGLTL